MGQRQKQWNLYHTSYRNCSSTYKHHLNQLLKQQNLHGASDGTPVRLGNSMTSRNFAGLCLMLSNRNLKIQTRLISYKDYMKEKWLTMLNAWNVVLKSQEKIHFWIYPYQCDHLVVQWRMEVLKKHYELLFSLRHLMAITSITVKNATRNVMLIKDWNFPSFLTSSHYIWNVLTLIILLCTESNSMTRLFFQKFSTWTVSSCLLATRKTVMVFLKNL